MEKQTVYPKLSCAEADALVARNLLGAMLRLTAINAYAAYSNTLVGCAAPTIAAQFKRSSDPQVGDTVLEISTIWKSSRHADEAAPEQFPALGVLLRVTREPYPHDEDDDPDDVATEQVWYIRPLDGSVPEYRWTNARFIRVFTSLDDIRA